LLRRLAKQALPGGSAETRGGALTILTKCAAKIRLLNRPLERSVNSQRAAHSAHLPFHTEETHRCAIQRQAISRAG
jgi:hypothetical protein